ncbi:MAG: SPFH domain-containing protein [Spirochaetota bacterium]
MSIFVVGAVALAVLFLIVKGVRIVPQAENHVVERFGKFAAVLKPGLNLINPVFSRVASKIDIREQVLDLPKQGIITADNATVLVDGVVFYKVMDPYKASYGIQNLDIAISNLGVTTLRSLMGKLTLDESFSSREKINQELLLILDEATDAWGTKITRVELKDVSPLEDLAQAMALQKKAEQEKRATILTAEASREAQMVEAEGKKRAQILEAEGRKEAAFRDAEARERLAAAEATALKTVADAMATKGDPTLYLLGQEYIKGLTKLGSSANSKFIVLPADIMSNIKGIFGQLKS